MAGELTYLVEINEEQTRVPDAAGAAELLQRLWEAEALEVWVLVDRGPRRRNLVQRAFGVSDRDVEPCFCLAKAGNVATLTFLDDAWSEYRAQDPAQPVRATAEQRAALSGGEPVPAPPGLCLAADRAFQAALEFLERGQRPDWLTNDYVR